MTKRGGFGVVVVVALLAGSACGTEIARIPFKDAGAGEVVITPKPGELALWAQVDLEYSGKIGARYEVEVSSASTKNATATCDALDSTTKLRKVTTTFNDHTKTRYEGKLKCALPVIAEPTTVRAKLVIEPRPVDLVVRDLSLIVKQ